MSIPSRTIIFCTFIISLVIIFCVIVWPEIERKKFHDGVVSSDITSNEKKVLSLLSEDPKSFYSAISRSDYKIVQQFIYYKFKVQGYNGALFHIRAADFKTFSFPDFQVDDAAFFDDYSAHIIWLDEKGLVFLFVNGYQRLYGCSFSDNGLSKFSPNSFYVFYNGQYREYKRNN